MPALNGNRVMHFFCFGNLDPNCVKGEHSCKPLKQLIDESSSQRPSTLDRGNFSGIESFLTISRNIEIFLKKNFYQYFY